MTNIKVSTIEHKQLKPEDIEVGKLYEVRAYSIESNDYFLITYDENDVDHDAIKTDKETAIVLVVKPPVRYHKSSYGDEIVDLEDDAIVYSLYQNKFTHVYLCDIIGKAIPPNTENK